MNKFDVKLIIIVLIVAAVIFITKNIFFKNNNTAIVYYENKVIQNIDLNKDDTYTVNGYNGEVIIEVKNKKIRVKEERSPLHICSKQGWVSNTPIVCLPNKIVINFENDNDLDTIIG